MYKKFDELFIDETKYGTKIKTDKYLSEGKYPIVDQGQKKISGYTDIEEGIFKEVPAIIFGDHTRLIKYIDIPFFIGADGVKIIRSRLKKVNYKYLYYALLNVHIPNTGYNRHFKWLKETKIFYPDSEKQKHIVEVLDKISLIIEKKNKQIEQCDFLLKSLFIEMFGDIINTSKYPTVNLGSLGEMLSGGTPSSKHSEYFGGNIPFISTPCLGENYISYKNAQNFLTDEGVKNSTTNLIPAYSVMIGSRVGVGKCSINMCEMCTNQDILSFINIDKTKYDLLFIKNVIEQHFDFYESQKRGATIKGISSKIVKETKVPKAPLLLQKKFANFVRGTDKSKYSSFLHLSA